MNWFHVDIWEFGMGSELVLVKGGIDSAFVCVINLMELEVSAWKQNEQGVSHNRWLLCFYLATLCDSLKWQFLSFCWLSISVIHYHCHCSHNTLALMLWYCFFLRLFRVRTLLAANVRRTWLLVAWTKGRGFFIGILIRLRPSYIHRPKIECVWQ